MSKPSAKPKKTTKSRPVRVVTPAPGKGLWVGGVFPLQTRVEEPGRAAYQPIGTLWMTEEGLIVGTDLLEPGDLAGAAESLARAMKSPLAGPPRRPERVRVADAELAEALRTRFGATLAIEVGPVPELEEAVAGLNAKIAALEAPPADGPASYLEGDLDPAIMGAVFRAAAAFHAAAPWKMVKGGPLVLGASIPALGVEEAVLCVLGSAGVERGLMVFAGVEDFQAYLEAAGAEEPPERGAAMIALSYDRAADLSPALLAEVRKHGWLVAGPTAYPSISFVSRDFESRPCTPPELGLVQLVALALAGLAPHEKAIAKAFKGGPPITLTCTLRNGTSTHEVTLTAPLPGWE